MKKQSWVCTFVAQVSLCLAFYLAFQIGQPQKAIYLNRIGRRALDVYFISVVGGSRPLDEQALLLKQMKRIIKMYNVLFVINISKVGEDDPLLRNATSFFQPSLVPWYTTGSWKEQGEDYYYKKISIPLGSTLDVIGIDTEAFQDPSSTAQKNQSRWLTEMLKESGSDWRIVVGYLSLINCTSESKQAVDSVFEPLFNTFLSTGVDAYLSGPTCITNILKESETENVINKVPYLSSTNQKLLQIRENVDGFLLHRISSVEFGSYLVNAKGEVVREVTIQPRGKEFI